MEAETWPYKHLGVIRKSSKGPIQGLVHRLSVAFEETSAACRVSSASPQESAGSAQNTPNEQRVAREDGTVISVLEKVANAVLGVARCVQSFDLDALADCKGFLMCRSLGDLCAVSSTNDRNGVSLELRQD